MEEENGKAGGENEVGKMREEDKVRLEEDRDGREERKDGVQKEEKKEGSQKEEKKDGSHTEEKKDGDQKEEKKDGSQKEQRASFPRLGPSKSSSLQVPNANRHSNLSDDRTRMKRVSMREEDYETSKRKPFLLRNLVLFLTVDYCKTRAKIKFFLILIWTFLVYLFFIHEANIPAKRDYGSYFQARMLNADDGALFRVKIPSPIFALFLPFLTFFPHPIHHIYARFLPQTTSGHGLRDHGWTQSGIMALSNSKMGKPR